MNSEPLTGPDCSTCPTFNRLPRGGWGEHENENPLVVAYLETECTSTY